jgi:predicted GNAT family N-acyltransferase
MLRVLFESFPASVNDDIYNHMTEYKGTLLYSAIGAKTDEIAIGSITCYVLDVKGAKKNGFTTSQVYDLFHETYDFYTHLYKSDTVLNKDADFIPKSFRRNSNVLIIGSLKVDPRFSGKKYGLALMRRTLQQLGCGVDIACLFAHPIVKIEDLMKDHSRAQDALVKYYGDFGFTEITNGSGVMAFDMDWRVPTLEELGVV